MKIAVVGTGYVGLVTGACLSSLGHEVVCVDVLMERVELINAGNVPFFEPSLSALVQTGLANGSFAATADLARAVSISEVTIIAVGTPSDENGIDLEYIKTASRQVGEALQGRRDYHVVVVKSTVIPLTTGGVVGPILEDASGLNVGSFGLCMNPEFLREGSAVDDFMESDRVVIGEHDTRSGDVVETMYEGLSCPKLRMSLSNAEMVKYASNCLLATMVSFGNEMAGLCELVPGSDYELVIKGLTLDRRLSRVCGGDRWYPGILSYLRPGVGFGGSCLPKDVNALRSFGRSIGAPTRLLDAVTEVNELRAERVLDLLEFDAGPVKGLRIAVLGLSFKPGTDDLRDSPAIRFIAALLNRGAQVSAYDPMAMKAAAGILEDRVELCKDVQDTVQGASAVAVATAWPEFADMDWSSLVGLMKRSIVLDARNALLNVTFPEGTIYRPVGSGSAPREMRLGDCDGH